MNNASISLFFVFSIFFFEAKGISCPNHCFCYIWGGLVRTDCIGRNLYNTFMGFPHQTQILDLSHNVISILHGNEFLDANLRQLQILKLSNNEIHKIDKFSFNGLLLLQNLDLSCNSIEYINPTTFNHNPNLKTLNMSFNPLILKKDEPFITSVNSLQILDMTECHLKFFTSKILLDLKNLNILNISRNYIQTIDIGFLDEMKSLKYLDVSKNEIPCNDQTEVFIRTLEQFKIQFKAFCQASQKMLLMPMEEAEEKHSLIELYHEDNEKIFMENNTKKGTVLNDVSNFFKSIPSFYAIVCGVQLGVFIGSFSTYLCLKKTIKVQRQNRETEDSRIGEPENLDYALISVQTPPGTPPSPYHSRFFSSNFSLTAG